MTIRVLIAVLKLVEYSRFSTGKSFKTESVPHLTENRYNLPAQITVTDLEPLFSLYGAIEKIELLPDTHTALIKLIQGEDAAIQALDGTEWHGILLSLEEGRGDEPKH